MKKHIALILAAFTLCLYSMAANAESINTDVCDSTVLELRCPPPRHFGPPPPPRHFGPPPPPRHFGPPPPPPGRVFVPPPPKCEIPPPPRPHIGHHHGGNHPR